MINIIGQRKLIDNSEQTQTETWTWHDFIMKPNWWCEKTTEFKIYKRRSEPTSMDLQRSIPTSRSLRWSRWISHSCSQLFISDLHPPDRSSFLYSQVWQPCPGKTSHPSQTPGWRIKIPKMDRSGLYAPIIWISPAISQELDLKTFRRMFLCQWRQRLRRTASFSITLSKTVQMWPSSSSAKYGT